jgi:cell wall-associated NlpC family hydrolase
MTGAAVAARARSLVGTRFRPQGRIQEHGLDCLGLVALAGNLPQKLIPNDYPVRSEAPPEALSLDLEGRVERISTAQAKEGDVLLVRAGAGQHHFLVLLSDGFVHADAGLRKVVETPGAVPWPALAAWRMKGAD